MKNKSNKLKELKRSMAFILVLVMIFTSLGISGLGVDQAYAAEGDDAATVRIVGPDNQFVITEASITINPGVTTLGAIVAQACADQGRDFELNAYNYPGAIQGVPMASDNHQWMSMVNDSSNKFSLGNDFTNITADNGDRIVLYQDDWPSSVNYSQFTILTYEGVSLMEWEGATYLTGTLTIGLEKQPSAPCKGTTIVVTGLNGETMSIGAPTYDYGLPPNFGSDPITGTTGTLSLELYGSCQTKGLDAYVKTFVLTSEEEGIVKPYLRVEMTKDGLVFTQPISTDDFEQGDPFVNHLEDPTEAVELVIQGVRDLNDSHPALYYNHDWALAMFAAGYEPTFSERTKFLVWALDNISDPTTGIGTKAKTAIALATIGVDARNIPDVNTGETINIVDQVIKYEIGENDGAYVLPFLLSLLDLPAYQDVDGATEVRQKIIQKLLDSKGSNYWGPYGSDGTGMVLPSLAPYYEANVETNGISVSSCQAITSALNEAVVYLSQEMGEYGGFPGWEGNLDANTQALVLTGLHSLEKDTHLNPFINEASGIDNLFYYRTEDDKLGFGDGSLSDELASKQGMGALASHQNLTGLRSSNLYNFDTAVYIETDWPKEGLPTGIQVFPGVTTYNYGVGAAVEPSTLTVQAIYNGDYSTATTVAITVDNVTHAAFTTIGNFTVTVNYLDEIATYVVSVIDPEASSGTTPVGPSISATIRDGNTIIASNEALMIEDGKTSALSALKMLAAEAGISIVVKGGYVSEINGLGEFSRGENSGWLYRVDGTAPTTTAAKDYKLTDGHILEWYFTRDYKKDPSSSAWQNNEEETTEFVAKEDGKGSATVEVSKSDMDKLIKDGGALKAKSSIATIELDAATLKGLGKEMGKDLEIRAKKVDITEKDDISQEMKDKIGDRPVLDLTVMSGTKQIAQFDGSVRVSIPYTLKEGEDPSAVIIYLIKDNGEIEVVKNAEFEPLTGEVKFTTSHFSLYGIGYKELGFNDIKGHWAKDYITYLAARDYITGMTKDNFDPNGTLTRGQFVQLLANLANVDLKKYGSTEPSSINDIKSTDWFAPAVAWAVEQGIVTGITLPDGTTSFYPEKSISRQDIAVMLNRYRDKIDKKEFPEAVKEKAFQDKDQIGGYAVDSVKALQKSGIIQGKSQTTFAPLDQAKRGEAAKMIHGMLKLN